MPDHFEQSYTNIYDIKRIKDEYAYYWATSAG